MADPGLAARRCAGAAMALMTACASGTPPSSRSDAHSAAPLLDPGLERLFSELRLVPGMAVAVVRDSTVVYLRGFGVADIETGRPVTPETPFYIASSTKSFMGTAAAILESAGVWRLDDPLSRWLPDAGLPEPLSADRITLRQLLTHTSRIDNDPIVFRTAYSGEHDRALLVRLLASSDARAPGFSYGNIGYVVASLAMDTAVAGAWQDVLHRRIFEPLGMRHTFARRSGFDDATLAQPHGPAPDGAFQRRPYIKRDANMHAAGGMITTAADLARWLIANLNAGRIDGRQAVPAAAIREAQARQAATNARFNAFTRVGYGLGWYHGVYDGDTVLHHFGNYPGFRAHVSFMPAHRIGVAVLTNESSQGYYVPEVAATYIYDRLRARPGLEQRYDSAMAYLRQDAARVHESIERDRAARARRPQRLMRPAAYYAGTYASGTYGTMHVMAIGDTAVAMQLGVLHATADAVDSAGTQLRVELVPGSGQFVDFLGAGHRADSLRFSESLFRRVR